MSALYLQILLQKLRAEQLHKNWGRTHLCKSLIPIMQIQDILDPDIFSKLEA